MGRPGQRWPAQGPTGQLTVHSGSLAPGIGAAAEAAAAGRPGSGSLAAQHRGRRRREQHRGLELAGVAAQEGAHDSSQRGASFWRISRLWVSAEAARGQTQWRSAKSCRDGWLRGSSKARGALRTGPLLSSRVPLASPAPRGPEDITGPSAGWKLQPLSGPSHCPSGHTAGVGENQPDSPLVHLIPRGVQSLQAAVYRRVPLPHC